MIQFKTIRCTTLLLALAAPLCALRAQEQDVTDLQIREAIEDEMLSAQAIPGHLITVSASDGLVTLTGKADNILARERAAAVARTVRGVSAVVNRIEVAPAEQLSGDELRAAVNKALLEDPATDSYEVGVIATDDGKVTLRGHVDSYAECELCAKVAKGVAGVTAVDNRITVELKEQRLDSEIQKDVEQRLHWDVLIDGELVDVACEDGKVTLKGTVGSASERVRARNLAFVAGCKQVDNSQLEVKHWARNDMMRGSKYAVRSEDQIKTAVEKALLHDPRVFSFKVNPVVDLDTVTLYGTVDNLKARRAAEADARNTVGVARVVNRLRVEPAMTRSSQEIAEDVRAALARAPYVDRPQVSVTVRNGIVNLRGNVDTNFERACADDAVCRVPGVIDVNNHLSVSDESIVSYDPYVDTWPIYAYPWYRYYPPMTFETDEAIAQRIDEQLAWSPFVEAGTIAVEVRDGRAVLTGTVGSPTEKATATKNAYDGGAAWVVNNLKVREGSQQGDQ